MTQNDRLEPIEPLDPGQQNKKTSRWEPYGVFGTYIPYEPGEYLKDGMGNIYQVTAASTYNDHFRLYDTPARLFRERSFDEQTVRAIEELGAHIDFMIEQEVHSYARLKKEDPAFELSELEHRWFTGRPLKDRQEQPLEEPIGIEQASQVVGEGRLEERGQEYDDRYVHQALPGPALLIDFDKLVEQRESVINEPLDNWSQGEYVPRSLLDGKGNQIDIEQISQAIDEGKLEERGPERDGFVSQELLGPAPLNFGEYMRERAAEFVQRVKDTFDTFGR